VRDDQLILCCNYGFEGKKFIDYNKLDSYALLNAVPTAEGAIKIAIENTPFTLWGSRALVIGNGRVGKILSHRLKGLGCCVTVSARKSSDKALIDALGIKHIDTKDIDLCGRFDIIFNTVDHPVLNSALDNLEGTLIIDLSTAGCIDEAAALKYKAKYLKLPGIPGKTAPVTAGEILFETVSDILKQKGEYS
jgi:dipicolinate synthase subunit A